MCIMALPASTLLPVILSPVCPVSTIPCVCVCVCVCVWCSGLKDRVCFHLTISKLRTYVHSIVYSCLKDRHVLVVISIEKLLEKMKKNNELLELILKVP